MQDVVIHRCTVRVVRRSGWSWGADRRALIRRVTDAVPALVAERLAALLAGSAQSTTIAAPIRVRMTLRLSDILIASSAGGSATPSARSWRARLDSAIDDAVSAAVVTSTVETPAVDPPADSRSYIRAPRRHFIDELIDEISSWRKAGILNTVIERLDDPQLRAWFEVLAAESSREKVTTEHTSGVEAIEEHAEPARALSLLALLREVVPPLREADDPVEPEPAELDAIVRSAHDTTQPPDGTRNATPDEAPDTIAPSTPIEASTPQSRTARITRVRGHAETPRTREVSVIEGEAHVPSALPWLVLGPLHKLGYLRTLGAALEAASLSVDAPLFGAALALKLTPPAERAWSKSAASERLAAAAAARHEPISKIDLHRFGARIARYCPLLDATIVSAIVAGRDRGEPWIVHRVPAPSDSGNVEPRFGIVDPAGLFTVDWGCRARDTVAILRGQPGAGCIILSDAADARLTSALDDSGVRFYTTARPGRNESWPRVPGLAPWRTNRSGDVSAGTRTWLRRSDGVAARLDAIAGEFGVRRIALALDPLSNLERSLAIAVSVALATLAWTLWHSREATDALLMLQRFEDLDARLRFSPRAVRVTVPLGRRHRDLLESGLLANVNDVPWLDGRVLEFAGG